MLLAMHIPDGFLDPVTTGVTWVLSAGVIGYCLFRLRHQTGTRLAPLIGVMAAGIFAGQMVNFPLFGLQTSGHLLGGVLAAAVLGPWGGAVAITAVLFVQCFVFADGGVTALGANVCNMAVVGSLLGYAVYDPLRRMIGGARGTVMAATLASWAVIPVAALAFAVEMSAGGQVPFRPVAVAMLFYHVLIGVGEALLTGSVVAWLVSVRPDLIYQPAPGPRRVQQAGQLIAAGIVVALAVAMFAAPWASELDDGLVKVAGQFGFDAPARPWLASPWADYAFDAPAGAVEAVPLGWLLEWGGVVTALMGAAGTLLTFAFALFVSGGARLGAKGPVAADGS